VLSDTVLPSLCTYEREPALRHATPGKYSLEAARRAQHNAGCDAPTAH